MLRCAIFVVTLLAVNIGVRAQTFGIYGTQEVPVSGTTAIPLLGFSTLEMANGTGTRPLLGFSVLSTQ